MIVQGTIKPCCQDPANLTVIEDKPHVLVRRCQVCGCRHFVARMSEAKPGTVRIGPPVPTPGETDA